MNSLFALLAAAVLAVVLSTKSNLHAQNLRDDRLDDRRTAPAREVRVSAILISAFNGEGETDPRLAGYENNLRRSLRFEKFGYLGEGSVRIAMPGDAPIRLPGGQTVEVEAAHYGEGVVWLRVIWMDGERQFMNVVYSKWPLGKAIVVGGLAKEGRNLAIILTPR